jgi:peroxiredoxin
MSTVLHNPLELPADLPVPVDDGAARHLVGMSWPDLALTASDGTSVNLAGGHGRTIVYAFPRTGQPGKALPTGWDAIPGARGCTPQACGFRDHFTELRSLGASALYGLSTQTREDQHEVATRLHLPFVLLSDARLELQRALRLPTFNVDGMTLVKRLTMILDGGVTTKVFYPVFPPDRSAAEVVAWLKAPTGTAPVQSTIA